MDGRTALLKTILGVHRPPSFLTSFLPSFYGMPAITNLEVNSDDTDVDFCLIVAFPDITLRIR